MTCIDYHHVAKCHVARCIKDLRSYKKFNQVDDLVKQLTESATKELLFFFRHRFDLDKCKTDGFGKYIFDLYM